VTAEQREGLALDLALAALRKVRRQVREGAAASAIDDTADRALRSVGNLESGAADHLCGHCGADEWQRCEDGKFCGRCGLLPVTEPPSLAHLPQRERESLSRRRASGGGSS
jgi:hypothetical protein